MAAWPVLTLLVLVLLVLFIWRARREQSRLLATVDIVTLEDVAAHNLGHARPIYVYLPPGYHSSSRTYPVLYVNDGQDREALRLHQTLAHLFARKQIRPLIVVAIPTGDHRLQEYGTAIAPNAQGLGARAGQYSDFVTDELMPRVASQFRTTSLAAFLGASLGGLSAFDIAWNHPDHFEMVGVFSGSFWWRSGPEESAIRPNTRIAHEMVRQREYRRPFRAWFEAGTHDETADRDNNGVIDAIQDTLELIDELEAVGYRCGAELAYVEIEGGRHNYDTWSAALPDFLIWAFGRGSNDWRQ